MTKKRIFGLLMTMVMAISLVSIPAYAEEFTPDENIDWLENYEVWNPKAKRSGTAAITHGMDITGTTGKVGVSYVTSVGSHKVNAYYKIERYVSGRWETYYTSPTKSGTFNIMLSRMHSLIKGYQYRVVTVGVVYDSVGRYIETVTEPTTSYLCY